MDKTQTFFFYDLETSGLNPRSQRIMQFAGQRTNLALEPVGEPINVLVRLSEEVLPEPYAIMITKITPQKTIEEGYSEAEFVRLLMEQVFIPNTITVGYNNIRFDDEFMRFTLFRNFYDPYEWSWSEGKSRWDLLDVVRMTRALRPEGIQWPVSDDGKPTNRLELLSKVNKVSHDHAHDAMSDVLALIEIAKLIKTKQPKLFEYLLDTRKKAAVLNVVNPDDPKPFIYASGRYSSEFLHTTVAFPLTSGSKPGTVLVWDLRANPKDWQDKSIDELKKIRFASYEDRKSEGFVSLPVKELNIARCPAVAPMGVLDETAQKRIKIDMHTVQSNLRTLATSGLVDKFREVFAGEEWPKSQDVDGSLYDSFLPDGDKSRCLVVRQADEKTLADLHPSFADERLSGLLLRYKARNFPNSLSQHEKVTWDNYKNSRIKQDLPRFMESLQKISVSNEKDAAFIVEELRLWVESIAPVD